MVGQGDDWGSTVGKGRLVVSVGACSSSVQIETEGIMLG